jgi:hypothetical protein
MNLLILVALLCDLLTPILIFYLGLPVMLRYIGHLAIFAFIVIGFVRMLGKKEFSKVIWIILFISVIGIVVALLNGQGVVSTVYGWWLMFKYPLFGLFVYLQDDWNFAERIRVWCIPILCVEVVVQILEYFSGVLPGDFLAGTLSTQGGTAHLALLINLVLALAFGYWIAYKKLNQVFLVIGLGIVSSVLGEIKLFYFSMILMAIIAIIVMVLRRRNVISVIPYAIATILGAWIFPKFYDLIVPSAIYRPFNSYFNLNIVDKSLTSIFGYTAGIYNVGRLYMINYVWKQISSNLISLLFGFGVGARAVSSVFGEAGVALTRGTLGYNTGTSLAVVMGEMGLLGLFAFSVFWIWSSVSIWKMINFEGDPKVSSLSVGVFLYTLLWPLWLFYTTAWVFPVPNILFWLFLGYLFRLVQKPVRDKTQLG